MVKVLWLIVAIFLFFSCASKPPQTDVGDTLEGTAIRTLPRTNQSQNSFSPYFSTIDTSILLKIQKGSPASLKEAMTELRNDTSEQAKVLLAISSTIMEYAWPSANSNRDIPTDLPINVYTSTLSSLNRGIFENQFESGDYFTLTLPSLVVFTQNPQTSYYAEAVEALEESLTYSNQSIVALYTLGVLYSKLLDYENAQFYLNEALVNDENNIDILYAYLDVLFNTEKFEEAYNLGLSLQNRFPNNARILEFMARSSYELQNFDAAESLIAQALRYAPDNLSLVLFRAKVLFDLEDYLGVSSLLDVYARSNTNNKDYLVLRAKLQSAWNKNEPAAVRTVQDALLLYPDDFEVLLLAATLASSSGQRIQNKTAMELVETVLEKDSDNLDALSILVRESVVQQNWQSAYEASSFVMASGEASLESSLQHVEISIELNRLDEARRTLETFYTPNSTDENIQQWNIRLLIAEQNFSEANSTITRLLPSSTGRLRSVLYFERSRLQSSDAQILSDLRTSLTANPRNEFALYGLYIYYYDREDYSKAQYYLKQVIALNPTNTDFLQRNAELDSLL